MNLKGLQLQGNLLNEVNVMAYDAGKYDAVASYNSFRKIYAGQINLGFELGPQSWGGYVTTVNDVTVGCNAVQSDRQHQNKGGMFVWSYHKDTSGSPSVAQTVAIAKTILVPTTFPPPYSDNVFTCPNCSKTLQVYLK